MIQKMLDKASVKDKGQGQGLKYGHWVQIRCSVNYPSAA